MVHQIHKLFEQLKLIPGQKMEVQKLLFSFIGRNSMHLVWFPCISCMEFRPPWSDFHPLAWKSDSSIPAWCGSETCESKAVFCFKQNSQLANSQSCWTGDITMVDSNQSKAEQKILIYTDNHYQFFQNRQKHKWGWKQTISWCEGHPNVPPFKGKSRHFGESTHNSTGRGERISMMPD